MLKANLWIWITTTSAAMAGGPALAAQPARPSTQKAGPVVYRLSPRAYPEPIKDEGTYAKWLDKQVASLTRRLKSTREPSVRVHLLLGLANLRLARQAEPALTRLLLGDESPVTRRRLTEVAAAARVEIGEALDLLAKLHKSPAPHKAAAKQRTRWGGASVFLAALAESTEALAKGAKAPACLEHLDGLTKSEQADLAAAARLLRAALMRQAGQSDKALAMLEPVLSPPKQWPHDFFARLLRCRLLADRGGFAVATALALQMDLQCERWFDKAQRREARRAIGLLRIDLAERWADRLQRDKLDAHAGNRRAIAERIRKQLFSGKTPPPVYRLIEAVPIWVKPPPPPAPPVTKPKPSTTRAARQRPVTTRADVRRPATQPTTSRRPSTRAKPTQPTTTRAAGSRPS